MKIFQNIPISSTNPFLSNRIVNHIRYTTPIVVPYGYSNYSAPSFPTIVANHSFFHPQTYSYPSPFPILNSNPSMIYPHSNNHFGQFYSTPMTQTIHYPTFDQNPILTYHNANQTFIQAKIPPVYETTALKSPKQFSEALTQTEPQYSKSICNAQTQTDMTIHEIGPNPDPLDPKKRLSPLPTLKSTLTKLLNDQSLSGLPQIDRYC